MGNDEVFLPAREITRKYSISGTTVWRRAKRGDLHPVRHGRMVRYALSEVQALWGQGPDETKGDDAE